ncbi:transposase [Nonomuraea phyllanthi]|uniref:transposase n=1 Tax=Nonomuraea phyllanthi TaxID=2219224 RepID=UPI0018852F36
MAAVTRRRFDPEFRAGALRIVKETGKPVAQVARDQPVHATQLGADGSARQAVRRRRRRERNAGGI